jgi:hypothetical protein
VLLRVAAINALLATLHQNGGDENVSPSFPHVGRKRIGDPHPIAHPDLIDLAGWLNQLPREGGGPPNIGEFLDTAPPGVRSTLRATFEKLQSVRFDQIAIPPLTVRGRALVQLSPPTIALAPGSTSEFTIRVGVRAAFTPDQGTTALPEPIHGEVVATHVVSARRVPGRPVRTILEVKLADQDDKIQFVAAPSGGVCAVDAEITAQVRRALRDSPLPVETAMPDDFPFFQFKEVGGGQALAVPVRLTPPFDLPAALDSVTENFLDGAVSVAVSREFVERQLERAIVDLRRSKLSVPVAFVFTVTTYHVSVEDVTLRWDDGSLDLIVKVKAVARLAPDFDITIRQRLSLGIDAHSQNVLISASNDDLSVSGMPDFIERHVRSRIIAQRDAALPRARTFINTELTKARDRINATMRSMDASSGVRYEALRVTPHGLILDGSVTTRVRRPAIVQFKETEDGTAFTALESWVPAGRIRLFRWSWIKWNGTCPAPWEQEVVVHEDADRFTFVKPSPGISAADVCLHIEGTQVDPSGASQSIAGGVCHMGTPELNWRMPPWSMPMPLPVWHGATAAAAVLSETMAGHVNVLAGSKAGAAGPNSLVHFADAGMATPLTTLGRLLARVGRPVPMVLVVVLPRGSFDATRREVEARLGSLGAPFRGRLLLTEDYTGSWGRTFGFTGGSATYLMDGAGGFVWQQEGRFDEQSLAHAIDERLTSVRMPRITSVGLSVGLGTRLNRTLLTDDLGERLLLRKLRGREVKVNFWTSWSTASIRELGRLQRLQETGGDRAPIIIAVNVGEPAEVIADVRRTHGLTFSLVPDSKGLIARQFGVQCWPTTISIDPNGIVEHIQLGVVHGA